MGRLYFADRLRGLGPIQKDRDACLFASFGCSSENGSDSCKGEGRGGVTLTLIQTLKDASYY